ncbi:hypothetical protein [Aeromonas media]|uniref:hypothetical protein n=1 Tax=Aeromonas media TaxID=651 RepID=UPI00227FE75F|nr:hypothetical protein [Aeromonas media]MCY9838258.1 hypothetical protein [Aeromonas media]
MRYLSIFLLSPSLAYAACAPGVNYGSLDISTPSPVCIAYSGSTLGGCSAYCGGGGGGTVCVELPAATPPIKGPYFSDGNECTLSGGGDGGGDNGGGDNGGGDGGTGGDGGAPYYYPFKNQVSPIGVGGQYQEATTRALKQIDEDIRWSAIKFYEQGEASLATFKTFSHDLMKVTDALTIQSNSAEESGKTQFAIWQTLSRSEDTLLHLTNCVVNPLANNCGHLAGSSGGGSSGDTKALVSMMGSAMGMWASTQGNTYSTNDTLGYVNRELGAFRDQSTTIAREQLGLQKTISDDLSAIRDAIKNGSGSGGEGGEGDKPCSGPLCTFSPSGAVPGSGLSDVFGDVAIAGVKQQVTDKKAEIQAQMDEIKGVFSPGKLEVSGNYENDYHDINGARVDLSGKSNIELFFSSGPAQVIWFLAVLIAFGILLGGRRDA